MSKIEVLPSNKIAIAWERKDEAIVRNKKTRKGEKKRSQIDTGRQRDSQWKRVESFNRAKKEKKRKKRTNRPQEKI